MAPPTQHQTALSRYDGLYRAFTAACGDKGLKDPVKFGPTVVTLAGAMMCNPGLNESKLPKVWTKWAEKNPEYATLLRRSVAELHLPDGRRFRPNLDAEQPKTRKSLEVRNLDYDGGMPMSEDGKLSERTQKIKTQPAKARNQKSKKQTSAKENKNKDTSKESMSKRKRGKQPATQDDACETDTSDQSISDFEQLDEPTPERANKVRRLSRNVSSPEPSASPIDEIVVKSEDVDEHRLKAPGFIAWLAKRKLLDDNFVYNAENNEFTEAEYPAPPQTGETSFEVSHETPDTSITLGSSQTVAVPNESQSAECAQSTEPGDVNPPPATTGVPLDPALADCEPGEFGEDILGTELGDVLGTEIGM